MLNYIILNFIGWKRLKKESIEWVEAMKILGKHKDKEIDIVLRPKLRGKNTIENAISHVEPMKPYFQRAGETFDASTKFEGMYQLYKKGNKERHLLHLRNFNPHQGTKRFNIEFITPSQPLNN